MQRRFNPQRWRRIGGGDSDRTVNSLALGWKFAEPVIAVAPSSARIQVR